ncbi:hypothetical protein Tco_1037918 [Tanacetum coccineum]
MGFTMGQDALKADSCKVTKHEKTCIENQHVFIPIAFDTLGFLAPEAVDTQQSQHDNFMTSRSINVKIGVRKCKRWYWHDQELDNSWYRGHLYEMYALLNPHQRKELATKLTSQEQLAVLQDEYALVQVELKKSQKNASFWKSIIMIFVALVLVVSVMK